jgi:myo-inositol 2-dehydrogenase/D-chiro-inositol 1-dehydrogenase
MMAKKEKVRVAVIGAGRIGKIHIENLSRIPAVELAYVVDVQLDMVKEWAKNLKIEKIVADPQIAINDRNVDAVIICSPTDTHADLIVKASEAGKDIFCEKPIDKDLNKIKKALKAVKEHGVKLQIGFNRRFDHNFYKIKKLVENGEIGNVHIVNITSRDPDLPPLEYVKSSGGIFADMTIHDFDMARYLVNSDVTEVYAVGNVLIDPKISEVGDFDTAVTVLKFKNGTICTIDNSRKAVYGYDQRVEVFGTKGSALAHNDRPTNVVVSNENGVCEDKPLYFFLERYKESFAREMEQFIECVKEGKLPSVNGEDGLNAMAIAIAANKSAKEKRVVKIEEVIKE